jgi:hypothetical protein
MWDKNNIYSSKASENHLSESWISGTKTRRLVSKPVDNILSQFHVIPILTT